VAFGIALRKSCRRSWLCWGSWTDCRLFSSASLTAGYWRRVFLGSGHCRPRGVSRYRK